MDIWLLFLIHTQHTTTMANIFPCLYQCFETRPGPAVEPINPVTQKKSGLDFMENPIFKNPQKPVKSSKTQNPILVEPPVEPINNFYFIF